MGVCSLKKILFVIILINFLIACSSGSNRRGSVKSVGERVQTISHQREEAIEERSRKEEVEKMPNIERFFPEEKPVEPKKVSSIWGTQRKSLYADGKASQKGDIVFVILKEAVTAEINYAQSKTGHTNYILSSQNQREEEAQQRSSRRNLPRNNREEEIEEERPESDAFDGQGQTSRNFMFDGKITARVEGVDRFGNLFIKGNKLTLVNNEAVVLEISGYVRSSDIGTDNTVHSENIDNMEFTYNGAMYLGTPIIRGPGSNKELLQKEEIKKEEPKEKRRRFFGIF